MDNIILLDGSYYVFYRFFATLRWWTLANGQDTLGVPYENEVFVEKFKSMFVTKLQEIPKKIKKPNSKIIAFKDCPRHLIWRQKYFDQYKANRCVDQVAVSDSEYDSDEVIIDPGPFFKIVYKEKLFNRANVDLISACNLEADDCIAITTKYIKMTNPEKNIIIISSDNDFLQLLNENVFLYNLKYKQIGQAVTDPKLELFVKCVCGDKSDNIKSVFARCGRKKAIQMYYNPDLQHKMFTNNQGSYEKYIANKNLIDFNKIPKNLIVAFYKQFLVNTNF